MAFHPAKLFYGSVYFIGVMFKSSKGFVLFYPAEQALKNIEVEKDEQQAIYQPNDNEVKIISRD